MSDRERWIVYPLLFLALGAALRDKIHKQTRAKEIVCERLYLTDANGNPTAVMIGDPATPISTEEITLAQRRGAKLFIGYVNSNVVDAENLAQRGQRVGTGGLSPQQIWELIKRGVQLGVQQASTPQPAPPIQLAPIGPESDPPPPESDGEPAEASEPVDSEPRT